MRKETSECYHRHHAPAAALSHDPASAGPFLAALEDFLAWGLAAEAAPMRRLKRSSTLQPYGLTPRTAGNPTGSPMVRLLTARARALGLGSDNSDGLDRDAVHGLI